MNLFGLGNRSPLQRLLKDEWKSDEERQQLIAALRDDTGVKASEVVPLLAHGDGALRAAAVALFAARADAKAAAALVEAMQGLPAATRKLLTAVFARLRGELATPLVDRLLAEPSGARQGLGWELALELPSEVRRAYAERAARTAPVALRVVAINRLLADLRSAAPLRALLIELAEATEDRVRERAVEALVGIEGAEVLELMIDRFAHDNAAVRDHAARHLRAATASAPVEVRSRVLKMLAEGDDAIRRRCVELLLATGDAEAVVLEILVFCRGLLGWLRDRILNTLKTFGDAVLRPTAALLEHPDEDVRMQALTVAEHFHDPRVLGPVVKLLADPDWWLRITACGILARLGDARAVPYLVEKLADDETRWAAIDALGHIGGEEALRALTQLLRDPRPEVRLDVIHAAARAKDARLVEVLSWVVKHDTSQEVKTRAVEVLRELGSAQSDAATAAVKSGEIGNPLDRLLTAAREQGASDVHISVGEPPFFRRHGRIERITAPALSGEEISRWTEEILDPVRRQIFADAGEVDFSHAIRGVGRYRANAFAERLGTSAAFRIIPNLPPTFADLRLPGHLTELLDYHQGLILVSGPAGGGKSTTLAALVNVINETKADHIITLEDPIEFVHPAKSALVNQREIGRHTISFAKALRAALREDPDVVMVGEMRDLETIRMALMAAETGHLVIATLHTTSAVATVDRLIESFPPDEQQQVRMGLSESLKYVVSQSLLPRADGEGRVAVYEILKGTSAAGALIREGKTLQLTSLMQISRTHGMQTVDQALEELLEAGLITAETACLRAEKKEAFEGRLKGAA